MLQKNAHSIVCGTKTKQKQIWYIFHNSFIHPSISLSSLSHTHMHSLEENTSKNVYVIMFEARGKFDFLSLHFSL